MLLGAIIGNNGASIFEQEGETLNTIFWTGVGGYAGKVSNRSGKVDQAAVQMRVWVQEAGRGYWYQDARGQWRQK